MAMSDTDTYLTDEMTISEVAEAFRVTVPTVRAWDRDGKLKSFRTLGNQRRFRRSENPQIPAASVSPEATESDPAPAGAVTSPSPASAGAP